MREIKVNYFVSTRYVGSDVRELVTLEVPDDATEIEIEDIIDSDFNNWVWENIESSWNYESI